MRVAVECQSPLLQKSLELFLTKYLNSVKKSDIIIRDEKCLNESRCFYISSEEGADLLKPFSKSQLILALKKKYNTLYSKSSNTNFEILEKRIELLTKEYQENILREVKAFYEK